MKRKNDRLDPISGMSKSEASTDRLLLEMMSKMVAQQRINNALIKESLGKTSKNPMGVTLTSNIKGNNNLPLKVTAEQWYHAENSPVKKAEETKIEDVF